MGYHNDINMKAINKETFPFITKICKTTIPLSQL